MANRSAKQWYLLHVKQHKEPYVIQQLEALNHIEEIFFPTFQGVRVARSKPYFPGYIFLRLDFNLCHENAILWLPGVKDLVRLGGEVVSIPGEYIDELKRRLGSDEEGRVLARSTQESVANAKNRPTRSLYSTAPGSNQDSEAFIMGLLEFSYSGSDEER